MNNIVTTTLEDVKIGIIGLGMREILGYQPRRRGCLVAPVLWQSTHFQMLRWLGTVLDKSSLCCIEKSHVNANQGSRAMVLVAEKKGGVPAWHLASWPSRHFLVDHP